MKLLLLVFLLVLAGSVGYVYYRASLSLPQIEGTARLPGLTTQVDVLRDKYGVPHIYASSLEDLARATGYVHAQDRYFQMEMARRLGTGRMAEVFGSNLLPMDKRSRLLGLGRAAAAEAERMDPSARGFLEAYAEGVNAYRQSYRDRLPPEFQILRLDPEPWKPADSLVIGKWLSQFLSFNGSVEILRARLSEVLGAEAAYPVTGLPPPALGTLGPPAAISSARQPLSPGFWTSPAGSNAWVVSGARAASGKPILASDPHLPLPIPCLWYEIHLVGGGLNVAGASLPGAPLVVIGHNEQIAWGVTALFADVQDNYVETLNPENPRQYAVGDGWADFEVSTETIRSADGAPLALEILRSRHGVVVSDKPREGKVLALRWDALSSGDTVLAFSRLNRARDWVEFVEALRPLGSIPLAFVYADTGDNIGLFPSGDIPVRTGFDGSIPVDGRSGVFEWSGSLPHEMKPVLLNPVEGFIVAANQKMVPDDAPYALGRDQLAPFRAGRIVSLIGSVARHEPADFARIQSDRYDGSTEPILRHLVSLTPPSEKARAAQNLLRNWDGQMTTGAAPALYQAFYLRLLENTFKDEMGEELFPEFLKFLEPGYGGGVYSMVDDPNSTWWDDRRTPGVEDRSAIFGRSLNEAVELLERLQGDDPDRWSWGLLHGLSFEHPLGRVRPLNWVFSRGPVLFGGSAFTIANAVVALSDPFRVPAGTSYRLVVDLSDLTTAWSGLPTGASGHPLSRHYFDQNRDWLSGVHHPLLFERSGIEAVIEGKLTLTP